MFDGIKETWRHLREAEPGGRFQEYHRAHQAKRRTGASKFVSLAIGGVLIAVGLVALPAPGPGTLVIALGAAFIARESKAVARVLDWVELRLRRAFKWVQATWKGASPVQRVVVAVVGVGVVGAAAYFAYAVTFGA